MRSLFLIIFFGRERSKPMARRVGVRRKAVTGAGAKGVDDSNTTTTTAETTT